MPGDARKFITIAAPDFDLALTLESGQTFHWVSLGNGFVGTIGERAVFLEQQGEALRVRGAGMPTLPQTVSRYFALDHPLAAICEALPNDPTMTAARSYCRGLRIMRQPHWECLATFITSSMKQVAHIRQISRMLRERFGEARSLGDTAVHTYPTAERIAALDEKTLRDCALGYRAGNLLATARRVSSGQIVLNRLAKLPDEELRKKLCELPGVGRKVANCVMLFAYERLRAFPIDVWVERVLRERYFPRRRKFRPNELQKFSARYFGEHGGYAQQYLFHHARMTTPRRLSARRR